MQEEGAGQQSSPRGIELLLQTPMPATGKEGGDDFSPSSYFCLNSLVPLKYFTGVNAVRLQV